MGKYVIRRLLQMIPLLLGISIIVFGVMHSAPGNPVAQMAFGTRTDPEFKAKRIRELGLDQPLPVQYVKWLSHTLRGDFGESIRFRRPVSEMILERLPNTLTLTVTAEVMALLIAIPVGVISATRQYSAFDYTVSAAAFMGISLPSFFAALLAIYIFGVQLQWFPLSGTQTAGVTNPTLLDRLHHLALPALTLAVRSVASYARFTRSSMLEVIRQDYVRTARAKGLQERLVVYKHALRNGLIPLVTLIGFSLPGLFGGAVLLEYIFVWPGMGQLSIEAVGNRDYPLLMATNMLFAVLVLLGNLVADILYAVVDPRIRYA